MDPFTTPDGVFRVDFSWFEMRMSHWVFNPRVTHIPTGKVVFDRWGTMEDASASVDADGRLVLAMREYPGSGEPWSVVFDPRDGSMTRRER